MYKVFLNGTEIEPPAGLESLVFHKTRSEVFGGFVTGQFGYIDNLGGLQFADEVSRAIISEELKSGGVNKNITFEIYYCDRLVFSGKLDAASFETSDCCYFSSQVNKGTDGDVFAAKKNVTYGLSPTRKIELPKKDYLTSGGYSLGDNNEYRSQTVTGMPISVGVPLKPDGQVTGQVESGTTQESGAPPRGSDGAAGPPGLQGPKGDPGNDGETPYIGDNGNWWIGETDTGVSAVTDGIWTKDSNDNISYKDGGVMVGKDTYGGMAELEVFGKIQQEYVKGALVKTDGNGVFQPAVAQLDYMSMAHPASVITGTNISNWNEAYSLRHTHANKTVLDGITAGKVLNWDEAYTMRHSHANKAILDAIEQPFTTALKDKLDGIAPNANNYVLPIASVSVLGGVKVGANLNINAVTGVLDAIDTTYSGSTSIVLAGSSFQRAALTGDVTASQNSNALTIAAGAVTNAKMANMAAGTIKGRSTAIGAPEDLTAAQVRTILNVADGANNYVHPTGDGNLHVPATGTGNAGKFLKAGAIAASIFWAPIVKADITDFAHTHPISEITGLQTALDSKIGLSSPLTGYTTGADSTILATDTLLQAFGKAQGQINNKQPLDGDLTAIAALSGTSGLLRKTALNTWTLDTNTYLTSADLSNYVTINTPQNVTASKNFSGHTRLSPSTTTQISPSANEVVISRNATGLFIGATNFTIRDYASGSGIQLSLLSGGISALAALYSSGGYGFLIRNSTTGNFETKSIDWTSDVTGKPLAFTPSPHTHTTADITDLASYTGFDSRYYTEYETDSLLSGKASVSHNHTLDSLSNLSIAGKAAGNLIQWNGSAWVNITPESLGFTGNTGTVTTFSAGGLSPLFTTSVATPNTTPVLSFTLSNAGANTWFGNSSGVSAAPTYNNLGALTAVNDTNVALTLGGTPATALAKAVSLTLNWIGQLSVTRGGTGASTLTGVLIGAGTSSITGVTGTAGQLLRRNASNTAYEFFSPALLTIGTGLTGSNYDGSAPTTWAFDSTWGDSRYALKAEIPVMPTNYVTTDTAQGSLSGAKVWTNRHIFSGVTTDASNLANSIQIVGNASGMAIQGRVLESTDTAFVLRNYAASGVQLTLAIGTIRLSTLAGTGIATINAAGDIGRSATIGNALISDLSYTKITGAPWITGNQTITLSGDVTGSGATSITTTIANSAVSNAKLANVVSGTIKGRVTAATGVVEDLTPAQVRTLLNVADGANNYVHPNSGVVAGTYNNVTVNSQGHVTAGSNVAYLTSESDPTVPGHVKAITSTQVSQWDTAFSWGNHATFGYLTALPAHALGFHSDVSISSPVTGQLLRYNGTSWANWTANYLTANQTITLSGAVTGSGTTTITTTLADNAVVTAKINNSAVTFAKMQNIATGSILGRYSASTGVVETIGIGSGLAIVGGNLTATGIIPTNYVTTDTSQLTGLTGDKMWTGVHWFKNNNTYFRRTTSGSILSHLFETEVGTVMGGTSFVSNGIMYVGQSTPGVSNTFPQIVFSGTTGIRNSHKTLIGASYPSGSDTYMLVVNSGSGTGNGLYVQGVGFFSDDVTFFSDRRKKSKIVQLSGALDGIKKINGYEYTYNGHRDYGVITDEVVHVLPHAVGKSPDGYDTLSYRTLHALEIEAIKELDEKKADKEEIERLKRRVEFLENQLKDAGTNNKS